RLHGYLAADNNMDRAVEKLRFFFGWSRESEMPRHYARAYLEPSLAEIWDDGFEKFVAALRQIEGILPEAARAVRAPGRPQ
ncbi:hypothetical protein, partial [Streptococcus pneumoniae]|uniref:hypothetical protein n=1 Tax=Streptococcus pneumoniae TaxID=1313 RepID=UPI001954F9D1